MTDPNVEPNDRLSDSKTSQDIEDSEQTDPPKEMTDSSEILLNSPELAERGHSPLPEKEVDPLQTASPSLKKERSLISESKTKSVGKSKRRSDKKLKHRRKSEIGLLKTNVPSEKMDDLFSELEHLEMLLEPLDNILMILSKTKNHSANFVQSVQMLEGDKDFERTLDNVNLYNSALERFQNCRKRIEQIAQVAALNVPEMTPLVVSEEVRQPFKTRKSKIVLKEKVSESTAESDHPVAVSSPPARRESFPNIHTRDDRAKKPVIHAFQASPEKDKVEYDNKAKSEQALLSPTQKDPTPSLSASSPKETKETKKDRKIQTQKFVLSKSVNKVPKVEEGPPAPKYKPRPPDPELPPDVPPSPKVPPSVSSSHPRKTSKQTLPPFTTPTTPITLSPMTAPQTTSPPPRLFTKGLIGLKVVISFIGAQYQTAFPVDYTLYMVKLELIKKIKRAGVKNLNPSCYHLCLRGLQLLNEKLTLDQLIPEDNPNELIQIELIRPVEYELNLTDTPLPDPIIVSENADVGSVVAKFHRICYPTLDFKKYGFYIVGGRFKDPERLDSRAKFVSYGFRSQDKLIFTAVPNDGSEALEMNVSVQYSPFDIIDKQKLLHIQKGYLRKQGGSKGGNKSWKKRWMEIENNCLVYYPDNTSKMPKGVVNLTTFVSVEEVNTKKGDGNYSYFSITTSERSGQVLLAAKTEQERQNWIDTIRQYCNLLRVEQAYNVNVFTLEDQFIMEGRPIKSKKMKKEETNAAAGSISGPFMPRKLFSVNLDWEWSSNENPLEVFEFIELLGVGACGQVFKAVHKSMTNFELAIKIIKQGDKSLQEALDKEIKILKKCRSENVVAYYGSVSRENDTWILMDYCGVGSVKDVMKVVMEALSETQCKYVLHHTLKGLVYMHAQGILHLDVKAANILLTETGVVKLADFGVSQVLKSSEMTKGQDDYVGSPLFMAPEIIKKLGYNSKADIWSLGITIIEMMEIRPPNNDIVNIEMLPQLAERPPPTFKNSTGASPEFRAFLASLFVKDPVTRPSAIDLLTNPLMQNVTGSDCLTSMIYECQSLQMSKRKKFTPSMLL